MKLLVFDVDGTIVDGFGDIKDIVIEAINERLRLGDAIAIASGRPYVGIKQFLDKFIDGKKFVIAANGAATYTYEGKLLDIKALTYEDYIDYYKKYSYLIDTQDASIYCYTLNEVGYFRMTENTKDESLYNFNIPLRDFNLNPCKKSDPILKIMLACEKERISDVDFTEVDKKFHQVDSSSYYHEYINKLADKAGGVEVIRKLLNLEIMDCYTFGDEMNDLLMIKNYNGIAMGNAIKKVKDVAHYVTLDVKDNGASYAIKNYIK